MRFWSALSAWWHVAEPSSSSADAAPRARRRVHCVVLEDRCLLSASPLAAAVDGATVDPAQVDPELVAPSDGVFVTPSSDAAALNMPLLDAPPARHELIVVDQQIDQFQQLIDQLNAASDPSVMRDVVTLDATSDGLDQITALLAQYDNLDAVHFLGHGAEQGLQFGSTWLTADNIGQYSSTIASWQNSLGADADLLFYGCDVSASPAGVSLLQTLASWTNADIAASSDATGSSDRGGDWTLEYTVGSVETSSLALDNSGWHGLLAGADVLVNSTTTNTQSNPDIAVADNGNYVVVWQSASQDGNGLGVYARLYDGTGTALTGEFLVNTTTHRDQFDPHVAMDTSGNFVVVWTSIGQGSDSANDGNIYFQRYDSAGNALSGETLVSSTSSGDQQSAAVAYEHYTNTFAVTWSSDGTDGDGWGVYVRRFNSDGTAVAADTRVNTTTANDQRYSDIAGDDFGNFYIVWQSDGQDGSGWGVYGRYLSNTGSFVGGEKRQSVTTFLDQTRPTVEFDGQGNWLTAYTNEIVLVGTSIYGQYFQYDSSGGVGQGELAIDQTLLNDQSDASIGHNASRGFIVTWTTEGTDGDLSSQTNVYGRLYRRSGGGIAAEGNQFRVNVDSSGSQALTAVSMQGNGAYVVAFSGTASDDSAGVYAHQFADPFTGTGPAISLNSTATNYSDNSAPLAIDPALTVTDVDSANLVGATVRIHTGLVSSNDVLSFTDQLGITGSFNGTLGVLTLSGTSSVSNYETALRSVTYHNTNTNPTGAARTIIFTVDDGTFLTSDARTVNVVNDNDAPVIANQAFTKAENLANGAVVGTVIASDYDIGDTKSFTITAGNTGNAFAINSSTGQITVATSSAVDFEASPVFTLTVQVTDSGNLSSTATVTVNLTNVNEAPTINAQSLSIAENSSNTTVVGNVIASDVDAGDTKTYAIIGGNTGTAFAINNSTGQIKVNNVAQLNYEVTPTFSLLVRVTDAGGLIATNTVTVNLTNVNEAPVVSNQVFTTAENRAAGTIVGTVAATDPDTGSSLSYAISGGNLNGAFALDAATGVITVANPAMFDFEANPTLTFTVQVIDQFGLSDSATVTVNLTNVNEAPTITGIADVNTAEDTAPVVVNFWSAFADPESPDNGLTYTIVGNTNPGLFTSTTFNAATGNATFRLAANANGAAVVTVKATDPGGLFTTTTFTINVAAVNDAPVAQSDSYFVDPAVGSVSGNVLANDIDIDGGPLNASIAVAPQGGTVTLAANGQFTYTPLSSFTGTDHFTYRVADGRGGTAETTVSLLVAASPNSSANNASSSSSNSSSSSSGASSASSVSASTATSSSSTSGSTTVATAVPTIAPAPKVVEQMMTIAGTGVSIATGDGKTAAVIVLPRVILPDTQASATDFIQTGNITSTGYQMNAEQRSIESQDLAARQSQLALESSLLDSQSLYAVQDSLGELDKLMKFDWLSHQLTIGSVAALSSGLSVGYVLWLIRGGLLLTSVMAQLPAWRIVDPLIVLENGLKFDDRGGGGESLASLLERHDTAGQGARA